MFTSLFHPPAAAARLVRFLVLASALLLPAHLRAQDLSLQQLLVLRSEVPPATPPRRMTPLQLLLMGGWEFRPKGTLPIEENLSWGWWAPEDSAFSIPRTVLALRQSNQANGTYDVLLYLNKGTSFNHIRRELVRLHLIPERVTCLGPDCLGERFLAPTYSAALYQGRPGDYPFVIVIQDLPASAPKPKPKNSTALGR